MSAIAQTITILGGIAALLAAQTAWMIHSLTKLGERVGRSEKVLDAFRVENHQDMATHTEAITALRERVAKLEA